MPSMVSLKLWLICWERATPSLLAWLAALTKLSDYCSVFMHSVRMLSHSMKVSFTAVTAMIL